MKIRKALKKDIPVLLKLLHQVLDIHAEQFPTLFKAGTTKYSAMELEQIIKDPDRTIFVAADENDRCIGYAFTEYKKHPETNNMYAVDEIYLDDLCVSEACRGKHVGELLFDRVKEYAGERKCQRVTLNVWAKNNGARAFYEKMGMEPVKTMMEYALETKE